MKLDFYDARNILIRLFFSLLFLTVSGSVLNAQLSFVADGPETVKIQVYPNPFNLFTFVEIHPDLLKEQGEFTFTLYNIIGKEVKRITNIKSGKVKVTRDDLPDGRYIYEIRGNEGYSKTGRLNIY